LRDAARHASVWTALLRTESAARAARHVAAASETLLLAGAADLLEDPRRSAPIAAEPPSSIPSDRHLLDSVTASIPMALRLTHVRVRGAPAAPAAALAPGSVHVVVFVQGLSGTVHDTRLLRAHLKLRSPHLICLAAASVQGADTELCIVESGARLAEEVSAALDRLAEDQFQARVAVKLGPMAAKFAAKVNLENLNPPASYTIGGEGSGGAMGFAKGGADVQLEVIGPHETVLKYQVKAQVGGKIAQLGARLIDSTAKQMADQFFDKFAANLTPPPAAVAASAATPAAVAPAPTPTPAGTPLPMLSIILGLAPLGIPLVAWGGMAVIAAIAALMFK
jgi:carbon monoxide dehydrogenase subunit G